MKTLTTLSNGIRVAIEPIEDSWQTSVRCMMCTGAINDPKSLSGLAHYLEHALCLGTTTRTEADIRAEEQEMGDLINAETNRDTITFVATVVPEDLPQVMNLFADIIQNPTFPADLLEREKQIVISEVRDMLDENQLGFMMMEAAFRNTPMGRPNGGYPQTIEQISASALNRFHRIYFKPENLIISVAGKVDEKSFLKQCETLFCNFKSKCKQPALPPSPYKGGHIWTETIEDMDSFVLAFNGIPVIERKERQAAVLFASMLESVLERELRLKDGLLYSIMAAHADLGIGEGFFVITASSETEKVRPIVQKVCRILNNSEQYITQKDLNIVKKRKKLLMGDFTPMERADMNAHYTRYFNQLFDINEVCQRIEEINLSDVFAVAKRILSSSPTFGCLGHAQNKTLGRDVFRWLNPIRNTLIHTDNSVLETRINNQLLQAKSYTKD